jgi:flagellar hook assembly protein FlgD
MLQFEWDGRDANGSLLPKGIYYYRVHNKQTSYSGKLIRN